jgi:hypothetical protein
MALQIAPTAELRKRADYCSILEQKLVMATLVRLIYRRFNAANDVAHLKQIALLCGAGLFVSLLLLTYGVDLSPGFF